MDNQHDSEIIETEIKEPLIQLAQICPYCFGALYVGEETEVYSGSSLLYKDWICHVECNSA